MAFTYEDPATKRQVFDAAATDIVYSNPAGAKVALVANGVVQGGYTDAAARNAIKTKTQIAALTAASTAADIVAALKA